MSRSQTPEEKAKSKAFEFVSIVFGENRLVSVLTIAILIGWFLDLSGSSIKGWHFLKEIFSERTSVLSSTEIEIANEWVVYLDTGAQFSQVEAHRMSLLSLKEDLSNSNDPWVHFVRNLRVVRDPVNAASWLLVADVNKGQSSETEIRATIECVKSKIGSWFELDTFGSSLIAATPLPYKISEFSKTYGRPKNLNTVRYSEATLNSVGNDICPSPYD